MTPPSLAPSRTQATRVLVVRGPRFALVASPYRDAHGEEDPYQKRGRPMTLCPERERELLNYFLSVGWDSSQHLHSSRLGADYY